MAITTGRLKMVKTLTWHRLGSWETADGRNELCHVVGEFYDDLPAKLDLCFSTKPVKGAYRGSVERLDACDCYGMPNEHSFELVVEVPGADPSMHLSHQTASITITHKLAKQLKLDQKVWIWIEV